MARVLLSDWEKEFEAKILLEQGQLSQEVFGIMEEAVHKLDEIFCGLRVCKG